MRDPGAPRHGRHSSPDEGWDAESPSWGAGSSFWADETPTREAEAWQSGRGSGDLGPSTVERFYAPRGRGDAAEWAPEGRRHASGLLDRWPDETGPMPAWRHRDSGGDDNGRDNARDSGRDGRYDSGPVRGSIPAPPARDLGPAGGRGGDSHHPSGPLPPMPSSAWSKLRPRQHDDELTDDALADDETAAAPAVPPAGRAPGRHADDAPTQVHGPDEDWDRTGGLEVIGAHVEEEAHRRGIFRRPRRSDEHPGAGPHGDYDDLHDDLHDDTHHDLHHDDRHADDDTVGHARVGDDDIPIAPYDPRPTRRRKRRKSVALLVSLVVLLGLAGGIVFGGQRLWDMIVPKDYTGAGTGSVQIRITQGETLTAIGQTMVDKGVIASVQPFKKAAEANPDATGIAPGIYGLRSHMSGQAALDLLLKPSSRLVSRVTLPEGLTAKQILQRLAQGTGVPIAELQAAAADPASLGLPAYANGSLEGFLFPATYDFEPGTTAQRMLQMMVMRTTETLDDLQIPVEQRLSVLTEASIVQAEAGSTADMPKIARVLDNRLAKGMLLQLDTTVNYANGKNGLTTTDQDRANPSPYNTYLHPGLPPGPISNPGEDALRAVLAPAQGDWLYFVVVNPDTGETRFAVTAEEHQANVALFQQWLRAHPGG